MFDIENPTALLHVILFIFILWIVAFSFGKSEENSDRGN